MSIKNTTKQKKKSVTKGFTLIEMLVSTFIFVIIVSGVVIIFSRQTASFSYLREQHRNIENAQFAINSMAKILRTSGVASITNSVSGVANSGKTLYVYNFSVSSMQCHRFDTQGGTVSVTRADPDGTSVASCADDSKYSGGSEIDLTTGYVEGFFIARETVREDPSTSSIYEMSIGLITLNMSVQDDVTATVSPTILQTSVSLRDYPGEISF